MKKRLFTYFGLAVVTLLVTGIVSAAAPMPTTTITLVQGLPSVMNVGDTYTVVVHVESDQKFISATALPSFQYAGKGVVAVQGGDRTGRGTSATLEVTYLAKGPTTKMPNGIAPVHTVVGVRYGGGYVAVQDYVFYVTVP